MKAVLLVAWFALATAGTAAAQSGPTPPMAPPAQAAQPQPPPPPAQPQQPPQGETMSEGTALSLSAGGTLAAWGMVGVASQLGPNSEASGLVAAFGALGILLGPSFGHGYAHSYATRGLGLRLAGAAVVVLGVTRCADVCPAPVYLGLGIILAGTIDDIATAPRAARRYNQQFQDLSLAPVVRRGSGGVALTGRF